MKIKVAIEDAAGELTTGIIEEEKAIVGETVTITGQDENGMPFEATGKLVEVIE